MAWMKKRKKAAKETGISVGTLKIGELAMEKAIREGASIPEAAFRAQEAVYNEQVRIVAAQKGVSEEEIRAMVEDMISDESGGGV